MSLVNVTDQTFETEVEKSQGVVLVDFWAPWCGPCKALSPTLDQLAQNLGGRIKIAKVNIDVSPESPTKYALKTVPTLILFKDGKLISQKSGTQTLQQLTAWVSVDGGIA